MGRYFIYGMGKNGIRLYLRMLEHGYQTEAFIDRDEAKCGATFDGVKCISILEYKCCALPEDDVIVAVADPSIVDELREQGIRASFFEDRLQEYSRGYEALEDLIRVKRFYRLFAEGADCIGEGFTD